NGTGHDARCESSAFLVEPVHDRQIEFGCLPAPFHPFIDLPGRVQGGNNAVRTIEAAAERLTVEVRPYEDVWWTGRPFDQPEHIPDAIDTKRVAGLFEPLLKPRTGFAILYRGGQAVNAVVRRGTNRRHVVKVFEKHCRTHVHMPRW